MSPLEPAAVACRERTRSAVLNILIAAGIGIAVSGFFLGRRDRGALSHHPEPTRRALLAGLMALTITSYVVRRIGAGRSALRDPERRADRFFRTHVSAAAIGALAVPLGLAYGWAIEPQLGAVIPFWVAALALGFLALPRDAELDDFEAPMPEPIETQA